VAVACIFQHHTFFQPSDFVLEKIEEKEDYPHSNQYYPALKGKTIFFP
jgi:hypothetical protein